MFDGELDVLFGDESAFMNEDDLQEQRMHPVTVSKKKKGDIENLY